MTLTISDGWLKGSLPDHEGREIPVVVFPRLDQRPWSRLLMNPPNPCLHTTEGGTTLGERYKTWDFPPNFACGDFKIVQLFPLGFASEAVDTHDAFLMQIELAYRVGDFPPNRIYLPPPSTLNPLVALAAFLHQRQFVSTFLKRPNSDWPTALDRLPAAKDTYYRRTDGTWPNAGVYGHVELPNDEHYDPASFDYPRFFPLVKTAIEGGDVDDLRLDRLQEGTEAFWAAFSATKGDPGAPPSDKPVWWRNGWINARRGANNPKPGTVNLPDDVLRSGDPIIVVKEP